MNAKDLENLRKLDEKENRLLVVGGTIGTKYDPNNSLIDYNMHSDFFQEDSVPVVEEAINWEPPIPLEEVVNLPEFPVNSLPENIRAFVLAVAESTATPVDMSAVAALAVVAGAVQKKYQIEGKKDYSEPLNIYTIIIADPAERKSSVMREMTSPIKNYEREVNLGRQKEIDDQTIRINSMANQISRKEKSGFIEEAIELKDNLRELEKKLIKPLRLIADDVTPEALTSLLTENYGSLSVISAEGGFFDILAGRYSNAICIDTVLKAHPGDNLHVDRKGRANEYIESPALTILLAVQTDVIDGLFSNNTFKGRGLNARFLYSKPTSKIGTRCFKTLPIPLETKEKYKELLYQLLDEPYPFDGIPQKISLEKDAYSLLESYFDDIEQALVNDLDDMKDWAGKLIGETLRIAGILHCMNYENLKNDLPVNLETMENAISIANYFLAHSKAVYHLMGIDDFSKRVKFVLEKLERKPKESYKKNEILLLCRSSGIRFTRDIEPILELLVEHNYLVKVQPNDTGRPGRKSAEIFKLNPLNFKF